MSDYTHRCPYCNEPFESGHAAMDHINDVHPGGPMLFPDEIDDSGEGASSTRNAPDA